MFLKDIIEKRKLQLEREMSETPLDKMIARAEQAAFPQRSFKEALNKKGLSVIAEVKKASPSKGLIQPDFRHTEIAREYERAGAAAVSVLTEEAYFMGAAAYLADIRQTVDIPVLRKDFIIDPYQVYEAKALGADALLLIAAALSDDKLGELFTLAKSLGLDVLSEAHNEEEIKRLLDIGADIIGINNRDLKSFEVDIENTKRLLPCIPEGIVTVCESGIKTHEDMKNIKGWGADGVLIGETLMRSGTEGIYDCLKGLAGDL